MQTDPTCSDPARVPDSPKNAPRSLDSSDDPDFDFDFDFDNELSDRQPLPAGVV
jgi:hypothetical protein